MNVRKPESPGVRKSESTKARKRTSGNEEEKEKVKKIYKRKKNYNK